MDVAGEFLRLFGLAKRLGQALSPDLEHLAQLLTEPGANAARRAALPSADRVLGAPHLLGEPLLGHVPPLARGLQRPRAGKAKSGAIAGIGL